MLLIMYLHTVIIQEDIHCHIEADVMFAQISF